MYTISCSKHITSSLPLLAAYEVYINARAAVLAAANPLFGRYNRRKSISENVDLPNSLLSRFDLLFLILDKSEMSMDLALSKHVLHVHRYSRNPDAVFTPIKPSAMKQFIAVARTISPSVPEELASYIVEAFVALRSQDGEGRGRGNDQSVMTARQLLSILRLSQALARLRLDNKVSHEDVDEAIRLTHASKESLNEEMQSGGINQEDVMSQIYSVIRDYANQQQQQPDCTRIVNYAQLEVMIVKKGFTVQALQKTLEEYKTLGVLKIDNSGTHVIFDD